MSELTLCNFCTLRSLRKNQKGGSRTYVKPGKGEWEGWTVVTQSGQDHPVAYFKELTNHCVC